MMIKQAAVPLSIGTCQSFRPPMQDVLAYLVCVSEVDRSSRGAMLGAIMLCHNVVKAPTADPESRQCWFSATTHATSVRIAGRSG